MHICSDDILNHTFNFMVGPTPIKLKISEHIPYKGSAIFSQVNSSVEFHFFSLAWSLSETESTWWLKVISLSWVFFFSENLINMYISPSLGPTILVLRYGHSFPWVGPTIHLNVWCPTLDPKSPACYSMDFDLIALMRRPTPNWKDKDGMLMMTMLIMVMKRCWWFSIIKQKVLLLSRVFVLLNILTFWCTFTGENCKEWLCLLWWRLNPSLIWIMWAFTKFVYNKQVMKSWL